MFKIWLSVPLKHVYLVKNNTKKIENKNFSLTKSGQTNENRNLKEEMEKIKQHFYSKGFEDGKREGERSVLALKNVFEKAVTMLEKEKRNFFLEKEKDLITIATAMARKIIRKEISLDAGIVEKIAREAIRKVADSQCQEVTVRINPQDWEKLKAIDKELNFSVKGGKPKKKVKFEKDENISPGGCIVETEKEVINATIENQLERLGKALLGEEK